jgi:hypothetical protein
VICKPKSSVCSGSGVELLVDFSQSLLVDVGIDLRGGNVDVAEHFLDASQVGAAGEQVRRKAVAKGMHGEVFRHFGTGGVFFY